MCWHHYFRVIHWGWQMGMVHYSTMVFICVFSLTPPRANTRTWRGKLILNLMIRLRYLTQFFVVWSLADSALIWAFKIWDNQPYHQLPPSTDICSGIGLLECTCHPRLNVFSIITTNNVLLLLLLVRLLCLATYLLPNSHHTGSKACWLESCRDFNELRAAANQ